jgi:hypothetical protein
MNRKLAALLVTASAFAVAVPVAQGAKGGNHGNPAVPGQAKKASKSSQPTTPTTPTTTAHPAHPTQSHKCQTHHVAYVESGTVAATPASTLAKNTDGTWSGTVVATITKTNHRADGDEGKTVTYTFTSAKLRVSLPSGTTGLTAGERVKLIGKLAVLAGKCPAPTTAAAPVFSKVIVHPAAS